MSGILKFVRTYQLSSLAVILGIVLLCVSIYSFSNKILLSKEDDLRWIMLIGGIISFLGAYQLYKDKKRRTYEKAPSKGALVAAAAFDGMAFLALLSRKERIRFRALYRKKEGVAMWVVLYYLLNVCFFLFSILSMFGAGLLLYLYSYPGSTVAFEFRFPFNVEFVVVYIAIAALCFISIGKVMKKIYEPKQKTEPAK